jgi:hypothetical protein
MLNNVKDFGAVGDGVADDRVAIQAAIDNTSGSGIAGILFPAGTYRVSRVTEPGGRWSLDLNGVQDFTIAGEGPRSIVRLVDTTAATGDWHVFILRGGCRRIVFTDLVVDGNRTGLTSPDEQSHGIEVEPGTEDLVVDRCILRECFGDGIRMLASAKSVAPPEPRPPTRGPSAPTPTVRRRARPWPIVVVTTSPVLARTRRIRMETAISVVRRRYPPMKGSRMPSPPMVRPLCSAENRVMDPNTR